MKSLREKNLERSQQKLFTQSTFRSIFPLVEGLSFQDVVANLTQKSSRGDSYFFLYDTDTRKESILKNLVDKFSKEKILIICLDKKQSHRLNILVGKKENVFIGKFLKEINALKEKFFSESGYEQDLYANTQSFLVIFYDFQFSEKEIDLVRSFKNKSNFFIIAPYSLQNFNQALKIFQSKEIYAFSSSPLENKAVQILDRYVFVPYSKEYITMLSAFDSILSSYEKVLTNAGFQKSSSSSNPTSYSISWADIKELKSQIKNSSGPFKNTANFYLIYIIQALRLKEILATESFEILKQEIQTLYQINPKYYQDFIMYFNSLFNFQDFKKPLLSNKLKEFFSDIKTMKQNQQPLKGLVLTKRKQFSLFIYSKLKEMNIKSLCYFDRNHHSGEEQYKILDALNRSEIEIVVANHNAILKSEELPPVKNIYLLNPLPSGKSLTHLKELVSTNFDKGLINFTYYLYR